MSLLSNIFSSRDEAWAKIAREIGAYHTPGSFLSSGSLTLEYKNWEIKLDVFKKDKHPFTRIRAPFLRKTNFLFQIHRENKLSPVSKFLGVQDLQIGDEFFDRQFIIKSNGEQKIKELLDDEELKNYLSYQPKVLLKIRHKKGFLFVKGHPDDVDELYFECHGVLKNEEIINGLFILFKAMLDRLVAVDLAYKGRPNYQPN